MSAPINAEPSPAGTGAGMSEEEGLARTKDAPPRLLQAEADKTARIGSLREKTRRQMQLSVRAGVGAVGEEIEAAGNLSDTKNKWLALASLRAGVQYLDATDAVALIARSGGAAWLDEKERRSLAFRWGAHVATPGDAQNAEEALRKVDDGERSARALRDCGCLDAQGAAAFLDACAGALPPSLDEGGPNKRAASACALARVFFGRPEGEGLLARWSDWEPAFERAGQQGGAAGQAIQARAKAAQEAWEIAMASRSEPNPFDEVEGEFGPSAAGGRKARLPKRI